MDEYKSFWGELSVQQKAGYIATGIAAILLIVFIIQNLHNSPINFLMFDIHLPLSIIILGCIGFGFCLSWLVSFRKLFRLKKEIKSLKEIANTSDEEV